MDYGVTVLNVYVTTRLVDDRILEWIGTLSFECPHRDRAWMDMFPCASSLEND